MSIQGNPMIAATNGTYDVIKRGNKIVRYGLLKKGQKLGTIKRWRGDELLYSMLIKGDYNEVNPNKEYTE